MGVNKNDLLIAAGSTELGDWTNPKQIGVDAIRPRDHFVGSQIGSEERGSKIVNAPDELVRAEVNTPSELFAADYISRKMTLESLIFETAADVIAQLTNRSSTIGHSVTDPGLETWDIVFFGPGSEKIPETGVLVKTVDRCDRRVDVGIFSSLLIPEDFAIELTGDNYARVKLMAEATPHPDFTASSADRKRSYGYYAVDKT